MWKRILLLIWSLICLAMPITVLAAGSVDIGVTAQGIASEGIINFTITYVSETQLKLDWGYGANVTGIMIRAKYGAYPNDILSENETPSDGYFVYSGNGTSTNDTSMNFDQNPGGLYYRAWAQRADGSWVITPSQGWKESQIMTLLFFGLMAGILSFLAYRSSYYIMKALAGFGWISVMLYWINSPPSSITKGTPVDTAVIVLLIVVSLAFFFWTYWHENGSTGNGRLRLPFMQTDESEAEARKRAYRPTRAERNQIYDERVARALRGETRR